MRNATQGIPYRKTKKTIVRQGKFPIRRENGFVRVLLPRLNHRTKETGGKYLSLQKTNCNHFLYVL